MTDPRNCTHDWEPHFSGYQCRKCGLNSPGRGALTRFGWPAIERSEDMRRELERQRHLLGSYRELAKAADALLAVMRKASRGITEQRLAELAYDSARAAVQKLETP